MGSSNWVEAVLALEETRSSDFAVLRETLDGVVDDFNGVVVTNVVDARKDFFVFAVSL